MRNLITGEVEKAPEKPERHSLSVIDGWREHPILTVAILVVGLMIALASAWFLGKPKYMAEATIYVSPTFMKNLEEDSEQKRQYDTFVQQQVNTITRYDILSESLAGARSTGFRWAEPGESEKEAVERLRKALEIRRIPETYQIAVGLRSGESKGLAEFVNALVDNFLSKARAEEFYGQKERMQTLESERGTLDRELAAKSAKLAELSAALGVTNFSPTLPNPYDLALTKTKEELNGVRNRRLEAEVAAQGLEASGGAGGATPGPVAQAMNADSELARLRTALNERRMELTTAVQGLGSEHPVRQRAEKEMAENAVELEQVTARTRERITAQLIATSREELRRARHVEAGLNAVIATQSAQAGRFSRTLQEGVVLMSEIERMRTRRNTIDDRIRYLTVESSAPGFLRMFAPAQTPEEPTKGRRTLLFAVFFAFTIALTCFVPVSLELANTRVRNSGAVEQVIGFPAVGQLLRPETASLEFQQEQVARMIAGIERSHQSMMASTFLLTPVGVNEGNANLASLLGAELKKRGKRTLIIGAGDPDFGCLPPGGAGLQDVLDDFARLPQSILPGVYEADRMYAGNPRNGSRFANLQRMPELLEKLHARYDLIVLAAAPVFLSSDTEYLVRCSDVTILHVDTRAVHRTQLERARELLERLQPGGLGVVITEMALSDAGSILRNDYRQFEAFRELSRRRNQQLSLTPGEIAPHFLASAPVDSDKEVSAV
jgi:polysaccharide biosynthesis transport protein